MKRLSDDAKIGIVAVATFAAVIVGWLMITVVPFLAVIWFVFWCLKHFGVI